MSDLLAMFAAMAFTLVLWDLGRRHYASKAVNGEMQSRVTELERTTTDRFDKVASAMTNLDRKHSSRQAAPRSFGNKL